MHACGEIWFVYPMMAQSASVNGVTAASSALLASTANLECPCVVEADVKFATCLWVMLLTLSLSGGVSADIHYFLPRERNLQRCAETE